MTKKKKKVVKKVSRKPAQIRKDVGKGVKKLYKGKLTKPAKSNLVEKLLGSIDERKAIKTPMTIKNRNKVFEAAKKRRDTAKKVASRERKQVGREKVAKAKKVIDDGTKVPNYVLERRAPDTLKPLEVKPKTGVKVPNKVKELKGKVKDKVKSDKVKHAGKMTAGAAATIYAANKLASDTKSNKSPMKEKVKEVKKEVSKKDLVKNKKNSLPQNKKKPVPEKITPRNKVDKAPADSGKKKTPPSTASVVNSVVEKAKKKTGKNYSPQTVEQLRKMARDYMKKNGKKSDVPWEKLIESLTVLLSSHIMSRGISRRYK